MSLSSVAFVNNLQSGPCQYGEEQSTCDAGLNVTIPPTKTREMKIELSGLKKLSNCSLNRNPYMQTVTAS